MTAKDEEDEEITLTERNILANDVDTSKVGDYHVTYRVADQEGACLLYTSLPSVFYPLLTKCCWQGEALLVRHWLVVWYKREAVSYTHLDVYKRQKEYTAGT